MKLNILQLLSASISSLLYRPDLTSCAQKISISIKRPMLRYLNSQICINVCINTVTVYSYELHHENNISNVNPHLQGMYVRLVPHGRGPGQSKQRCVPDLTNGSLLLQS